MAPLRRGFSFVAGCALIAPMDEDLANIIRTALDEAKTAGRDRHRGARFSVDVAGRLESAYG